MPERELYADFIERFRTNLTSLRAMSEAQYVCTGQVGESALSHYGLGLQKYTHFTSPIRRYADVVVHKQLLEVFVGSPSIEIPSSIPQSIIPDLIPESKTISILGGEGISQSHQEVDRSASEFNADLNQEASEIETHGESASGGKMMRVYEGREVARICDILNRQNRMAKVRDMCCLSTSFLFPTTPQRLFCSCHQWSARVYFFRYISRNIQRQPRLWLRI